MTGGIGEMSININNILLRVLSDPNYTAKGSALTWAELDTDLKILADNIAGLLTPSDSGFSPYDNGITYSNVLPDYVTYGGNIYEYINAVAQSGITPGSDPLTWSIVSVGKFSHQQNTDQYLDYGGTFQMSSEDIYNGINAIGEEQIFRGEWNGSASPAMSYNSGDVVLHNALLWEANANNTNSEPGVGSDWDYKIVNDDAYGFGYTGSLLAVTQNRFYQVIQDLPSSTFDDIYYRLDGTFPLTGDMDADGNFINELGGLRIGTYGTISETQGGLAYITGNALMADPVLSNTVVKTDVDDGNYIRMRYDRGISFHTGLTGSIGTTFDDESNERLLMDLVGNFGINGDEWQGGVGVGYIADATTEPTIYGSAGSLFWSFGQIFKTNSSFSIADQSMSFSIGDMSVDGSWRRRIDAGDLIEEKRVSGVWVEKSRIS